MPDKVDYNSLPDIGKTKQATVDYSALPDIGETPAPVDEQGMKDYFSEVITPKTPLQSVSEGLAKAEKPLEKKYAEYTTKKVKELTGGLEIPNPLTAPDPETFKADMANYERVIRENPMAAKDNEKITAIGQLIQKSKETDAVLKDYESNTIAGNLGAGVKAGLEEYGRGYFEMAKNLDTNSAIKDLDAKFTVNDKNEIELKEGETLDQGDILLLQAVEENNKKAKQLEALDPTAFNIGKGTGTSLGYTGEFFLTGGMGAGVSKFITKGVTKAVAEGAAVSAAKRIGVGLSAKLAQTGIQVAAMPTFYKGIAEDVSRGENFGESLFKNYARTFSENFTERIFLKNPWNKSTVGAVDNFMGRLGVNMHTDKGLVGVLASTGEEVLEEKIGEVMQAPLNYDNFNTFWKDFWDVKKNAELIGSVALMVAPMGIVSYSAKKWDDVQLNKVGKQIPGEIRSQLDEVLNDQKLSLKEQYDLVGRIVQDHANNQTLGENPAETAGNIIRYTEGKTRQAVVSAVEDRAKTPTIGEMEEITTEDQAKVDYLEGQGVKIPDGTSMTKVNEMYEAEKVKNVPETIETLDAKIAAAQKKLNLPTAPELTVSEDAQQTLDKLDNNEPVTNEFINKASDELYAKYKELEAMKKADTRRFTTEQINDAQGFLEEEITKLENFKAKQTEEGKFVSEQLSSPENISPGTGQEVSQKENISEPTQEKVAEIKSDLSETQPTVIQETEKSLQNEKLISENENLNLQKDEEILINNGYSVEEKKNIFTNEVSYKVSDNNGREVSIGKTKEDAVNNAMSEIEKSNKEKAWVLLPQNEFIEKVKEKHGIKGGVSKSTAIFLIKSFGIKNTNEILKGLDYTAKNKAVPSGGFGRTGKDVFIYKTNDVLGAIHGELNKQSKTQQDEKQEVRGQETTGKEVAAEEKLKQKSKQADDLLFEGLSDIADLLGTKLSLTGEQRVKVKDAVRKVAKGLILKGEVKIEQLAMAVKDYFSKAGHDISDELINETLKEEGYATENGNITENGVGKRSDGNGTRKESKTGGSDSTGSSETKSKKEKVRRSRYGTRVAFGKKTPKSVKEKYAKEKLYEYKEETHGTVDEAADKYLAGATTEQAMKALHDNEIPRRVRTGIAVGLIKRLNDESTPLYQKGDKAAADKIMDDIVLLHDFIQKEIATESGRDISYLGSNRVMEILGSYQTAELARRGMDKSRSEGMKKKSFKRTADFAKNEVEKEKKKVIEEVIEKIVKPKETKVSPEIEKIRKERSSLIAQWKKARKSTAYSAVIPGLTQADIEFIPQLAASYIKEGFYQTKVIVKKIQRVLDREGIKVSDADLETLLPKEYEGKPLSEYQQAEDLKKASLSLASQIFGDVIDKKSPESDPIVRMVKTLFSKFKETQLDRKKVEGMSDLEKLAYAIREKEKYKSVWIEAKQKALDIIKNNKNLSDEQKETAIERIETAYKNATQFTFSQKLVTDLIREELAEKGTDIGEVVRDHYESKDIIKADLVKSLVEKAGLDEKQAKLLADAVDKAFSTLMTTRIQGVLKKYMEKSTRKTTSKQKKGAEEIVHLASIGAFDNEKFREAFADMWGLPKLDDADVKSIVSQAEMITKIKSEAIRYQYKQQLLAKIANMQGMDWDALWDGFWYANVLSGFGTQTKNFLDAATASTVESMLYSGTKMSQISRWRKAYANALKGRGFSNARNTLRTGNHPFEFGTDAPKQAKRILDSEEALVRNKAAWKAIRIAARYSNTVFNVMMSNDALWNTVAYESILDALVTKDLYKGAGIKWWNRLSKEQKDELNQKIDEMLKVTPEASVIIDQMVAEESEAFKQVQAGLGEKQTGFTEMQARLRKYEIMDEMRPKLLVEEARRLAQMTLGNINPYGKLGWAMSKVSEVVNDLAYEIYLPIVIKGEDGKRHFTVSPTKSFTWRPLSKVVPFTRIITSIASRALGWNPLVMATRYKWGYGSGISGTKNERFRRQLTDHEKKVILKKAIVLASTYSILYMMSGEDEPEDGWIRVTANGTGDWTKNKQLEASGWRPYSIQFGDFSISYQYVYPLNGILGAFGYARDQQLYKGADKSFSSFMKLLGEGSVVSLAQVLFSTPMSGLNSVLDLMTNIFRGETGTASGQITKLLANIGGGFVAPRVLKDMEATYDILAERSDIEGVTFWEKMSDKVPFVGRNFAGKVERLDMFGDPFKVKGAFAAVLERDTSRPTSDLARWITEEIKYYRPIPDINREKFILMEKGGETDLARPLTGGNNTEEWLWTEYNRKLGQLFKEKAMELKASGYTKEEIKKEFELAWVASAENGGIQELAKAYVLELSEAHPLDKP